MTRPVTADLRRESIDMLGISGLLNEKHSATNFVDDAERESVPMRRLDPDSKKAGEFIQQNGHRGRDDKRSERFVEKRWGLFRENYRKMQNYCFRFLEMPRGFLSCSYHALLFFLVISSLILTVLSTVHTEDNNFEVILYIPVLVVEIILIIIFTVEYIVRIWAAGCRSAYVGLKGRLRFAIKIYSIIDMIVIISSIVAVSLASNVSTSPIRLLRFLPLLRVLRFDRQGGTWKLLGSVIYVHRQELLTTFYLGFISLIFASFVLYMAEKDSHSEKDFKNWPSSFWWGIVTLTTVGYGDAVPETWYGKMCASVFALCGISFFALPAGILGSGFALKVTQQQRQKHFHRRRRPAAILLQSYWRLYCADLNSKSVATWLPSIYYSRQQHLLKSVMEKTGTTGTAGDNSPELDSRKRKRSIWSKPQKGLRRGSLDVLSNRSDSNLPSNLNRNSSTCSALADSDFFDGRSKHGLYNSHDALVTMFSSQNIHCSIVHPLKSSNPASLCGDENALLAFQQDGETPCIELSKAQKLAIRLIRILKLRVAIRKFKEARRPYDVKDVIEQYSTGHVEMLARVKNLQAKMDKALGNRAESGDDGSATKMGLSSRLTRVEQQVNLMHSKLETVLQILHNMQNTRSCPSGGSNSYDLFRGNADGVSSRRSSVSRAHSDPLDVRTQLGMGNNCVTTHVSQTSDIPCVTLSDPESVLSSLSECDRSQGSRPVSQNSLHGSLSDGDHQNISQLDGSHVSDVGALNAPLLSRVLATDKRQLSDVTEESLTGSKETLGGLTPPGPISQQNSTASETDPVPGGADTEPCPGGVDTEPGPPEIEVVWEKQEPISKSPRRKRSQLNLSETKLTDDEASSEQTSLLNEQKIDERYAGTPDRKKTSNGHRSRTKDEQSSLDTEASHFDDSARSAPTRISAKRRPLVKSNPVEV